MDRTELAELIRGTVHEELEPLRSKMTDFGEIVHARGGDDLERHSNEKGIMVARVVRAVTAARGDIRRAKEYADRCWKGETRIELMEFFEKASEAQDFDSGGFMIPSDMSDDIIDLLRPRSVMRAAGVPTVPMPRGSLTMPKQTGDISANYVGESEDITASQPTGGQILLSARKLSALVPISNDLLSYSAGDSADRFIRNSIVRRIGIREDRAFTRDDGTQNTPKGIRHWAATANVFDADGTPTAATVEAELTKMLNLLEQADVDMADPAWIMSPRSKNFLMNLREASGGNLIYPEMRNTSPSLLTFPVFVTTNIPNTLGAGSDESEIYLFNVSDSLIGEAGGLEITADSSASYIEGSTLVSAFSRDQTVIRAIMSHDFAVLHEESVSVLTAVLYGS